MKKSVRIRRLDTLAMAGGGFLTVTLVLLLALIFVKDHARAAQPLKACEVVSAFQQQDDGVLTLTCMASSEWVLFTGSSIGDGYRIKWTARTTDYPYTGVVAAGRRFKSSVIPETAPVVTASMSKDGKWPLELRAEPKGSSESSLTLVVNFGTKKDGDRRKAIITSD